LLFIVLLAAFLLVIVNLWLLHILFGAPNVTYISRYKDIEFWSGDHFSLFILLFVLLCVGLFPDFIFSNLEELAEYYFTKLADISLNTP
jgi:NADH:ubiquinone oxidoreductase subunit 4 (subunit M)